MARRPKHVDELHALKVLSLFRKAKREDPELGIARFFESHGIVDQKLYLPQMLDVLEARYGFRFLRLAENKTGRSDLVSEAHPILDRFDAAFDRFLAEGETQDADPPARIGAWGAVLDTCLAPALVRLQGAGAGKEALAVDGTSLRRGMRRLVRFEVDAILWFEDRGVEVPSLDNLVQFHPGNTSVELLRVSGKKGESTRVFARGILSVWARSAPQSTAGKGDLVAPSPYSALELVRSGVGAAVVVGFPAVRRRAKELRLTVAPVDAVPALTLGVYTRNPRERMLDAKVWTKVEGVLTACADG